MSDSKAENFLTLNDLRAKIDQIDDRIHDLIMERAALVEDIRNAKGSDDPEIMQPAREAEILRRLVSRHRGDLPPIVIVQIWRQLIPALTALQMPLKVAVYAPDLRRGFWDIARDHFGGYVPMQPTDTPAGAIRAVSNGNATVAVVPWPENIEAGPWWGLLNSADPTTPRIVSYLPFIEGGNARSDSQGALAVAQAPFRASGDDRSLILVEFDDDVSRSRLMEASQESGLEPVSMHSAERLTADHPILHLIEYVGFVSVDDERLDKLAAKLAPKLIRMKQVGGYARPIDLNGEE